MKVDLRGELVNAIDLDDALLNFDAVVEAQTLVLQDFVVCNVFSRFAQSVN